MASEQAGAVAKACQSILGFEPAIRLASRDELIAAIGEEAERDAREIFVLPVALDFDLLRREALGQAIGEARRAHPQIVLHHDDVDPGHPLLVEALADQLGPATGLILAASGHGDPGSRAQSYRLMRLIWERLSLTAGEVGFVRHAQPFLAQTLEKCTQRLLNWVMLPQALWRTEHVEFAEVILENFQRDHSEAASWRMADPPGNHPAITAWLTQRITRLWNEKRARESLRIASPKQTPARQAISTTIGSGIIASIPDCGRMASLLEQILPAGNPGRVLVKVTWHGYASGTYTDPAALDLLLRALPAPAIILEGHTSSRNLQQANFDWESEARENRAWIRQQDAEYLRRTGLADVLAKHSAHYLNVTEAYWDEGCDVSAGGYIPRVLLDYAGCPMISFAKFKGPTRLGISNLFGLIPDPLRSAWHGPNITFFARVCCDIAKLYGALFPLIGINEALYSAVRWNRKGLYRSRWGNYDLISNAGYLVASDNLAAADILASRLQGQDVNRSAFFDVVRAELGWDEQAASDPLPQDIQCLFA
ncbi:MAG TPA: CbiX/SirB N-terminal domain-containing protein [Bryobacteraceae bacterium]|nr:CbiX/SirB N-terminal domain-containing protein [Bryobacteraceae bacterium]